MHCAAYSGHSNVCGRNFGVTPAARNTNNAMNDPELELMKNAGQLKLPETDVIAFTAAIQAFGFEKPSIFLRRCAYAIIKRHAAFVETGEELSTPLDFKTLRRSNNETNQT